MRQTFRVVVLLLAFTTLTAAQNRRFDGVAFSRSGMPAPGASVAICSQTAITAISESGNTVTVTSTLAPPPINGTVTIFDVVPAGYNGTWTVLASSPTFFTFFNPLTGLGPGTSFGAAITSGSTACSTPVALCSSPTDGTCASPNPVTADGLGNYFFYVQSSVCTVAAPCAAQIFGSALTTRVFPDQSYGAGGGGGGLTCSPQTAYSLLYFDPSTNCISGQNLAYGFYAATDGGSAGNTLAVGGGSSRSTNGAFMALGPSSGNNGAYFHSNSAGTQFVFGANAFGMPATMDSDHNNNAPSWLRFQNVHLGWEFIGTNDALGSGTAAGLKVTSPANTLDNSPGASNSLTAGNSVGSTANNSPGGDSILTSGNYTGAGNNRGGDVTLNGGTSSGTGRGGNINLNPGTGTPNGAVVVGAGGLTLNSVTFATLPASSANGSLIYCSDCNSTCTAGGSTGRTCFRENGAWTH